MYASYFTSAVTLGVKVEWSLEMGAEQSSDLGVGWNLEQQKCEMGHPLTRGSQVVSPSVHLTSSLSSFESDHW